MDGWNFRGTGEKKKNEAKLSSLLLLLFFVSIILKSILLKMLRSSSSNVSFFERISLSLSLSLRFSAGYSKDIFHYTTRLL